MEELKEKVISIIRSQTDFQRSLYEIDRKRWIKRVLTLLETYLKASCLVNLKSSLDAIEAEDYGRSNRDIKTADFRTVLRELIADIEISPETFLKSEKSLSINKQQRSIPIATVKKPIKGTKIFIVHGHDELLKTETARMIEKLGLYATILHDEVNSGETIIEKFEREAAKAKFAVVLLTPDDQGHPVNNINLIKPRARQNVILELGYFVGLLGRANVCVLHKGNVEMPSDYHGIVYISVDDRGRWKFDLAKEMKNAGLSVDLNAI